MNGAPLSRASRRATSVFPDAGGADHDDVVGGDLVPDVVRRLGPAPAVPHRDGDRLLGGLLAHDVAVELGHDLAGRHLLQPGRAGAGRDFGRSSGAAMAVGQGTRSRSCSLLPLRQLQNRDVPVGEDADVGGDLERALDDVAGAEPVDRAAARGRRRGRSCRPSRPPRCRRRARSARPSRSAGSCARGRPPPAAPRAGAGSGRCASPWPARPRRAGGSRDSGRASPRTSRTA